MKKSWFGWIAFLTVVGCSGGGEGGSAYTPTPTPKLTPVTVAAGQEAKLFPVKVGNTWTYAYTEQQVRGGRTGTINADMVLTVKKVEPVSGGQRVTMSVTLNGKPAGSQNWLVTSKGIFQQSIGGTAITPFNPPLPALQYPVEANKKYSWKGKAGSSPMAANAEIIGSTEVDTEMKRFAAIQVDMKYTKLTKGVETKAEQSVWFVPDIGIVRLYDQSASKNVASRLTLSLKDYEVK